MELIDRIRVVIKVNGLTPSAFADEIGVKRSNVSHILSGRNKPGFEFLEKLLIRFPKVNAHWLITGVASSASTVSEMPVENKPKPSEESQERDESAKSIKEEEVERMVVFFRDGTFANYVPRKEKS
ncbi:MAG: XRE family transcriptional regulator [Cryomorphaceae bacterium]|nr:MAG: XRE family transcriptional regulator [Cryomorphaceae bacterium]